MEDYTQEVRALAATLEAEARGNFDDFADYEEMQEHYYGSVLDITFKASYSSSSVTVRTVTLVLGTGGPHQEIEINPGSGRATVRMHTWLSEGLAEHTIPDLSGHPLHDMAQLVSDDVEGRL